MVNFWYYLARAVCPCYLLLDKRKLGAAEHESNGGQLFANCPNLERVVTVRTGVSWNNVIGLYTVQLNIDEVINQPQDLTNWAKPFKTLAGPCGSITHQKTLCDSETQGVDGRPTIRQPES